MSLIEKLKLGTRNKKLIKWPGDDTEVLMRILSEHERMEAMFSAERLFKTEKIEPTLTTADQFDTEKCVQILYRAIRDPATEEPIATSITEFRKSITREDMRMLISEYTVFEQDCSPSPSNLSEEEFDKILRDIKKNPETLSSSNLSSSMLKKLIITLASQPVTLPKDSG